MRRTLAHRTAAHVRGDHNIPYARDPQFSGGEALLQELESTLLTTAKFLEMAIVGASGIGKSQLALELAYRTIDKYPSCSVFWVPATNYETVRRAYHEIGERLEVPGLENEGDNVFNLVQQRLSNESTGQWLFILDDANDLEMWLPSEDADAQSSCLASHIPRSILGSLVITTRSQELATGMAEDRVIVLTEKVGDVASKTCWSVPFRRNPRFVGRSTLLAELEVKLAPTRSVRVAICGLGGIGKTQIALELAYRTRASSVFWVPAQSSETVRKAYVDIGRQLNVTGIDGPKADVLRRVPQHLSRKSAGQWLLIYDGADDDELWFKRPGGGGVDAERLIDYMPCSSLGTILITTRSRKMAVRLAGSEVFEVPELDKQASLDMLRKALIAPALLDADGVALELLKQLTFLPLAITQAVAFINENNISIAEYLSLLSDTDETFVELLSEDFEDGGRYPGARNPIVTTWFVSFEHIRRCNPLAADYLSFMACVEPKNIPTSMLPDAKSKKQRLEAIRTLTAYSFATRHPDGKYLDLHQLVHVAMRTWLKNKGLLEDWTGKALAHLVRLFPDKTFSDGETPRAYLPHVRRV